MQVASCDARPRTREESNPRPAGSGSRRANHETTPEDQFEKSQKTSTFCTSTTPIPAEGCASTAEIAKNLEFLHLDHADPRRGRGPQKSQKKHGFLHLDHADPRRGSRGHDGNRKKPRVFAPRPRRSPHRVARACWKPQKKTMGFCTSTTPIPAQGRAGMLEIAKNHGFLHLDHADPRRGSREHRRNRKKPWIFAPRPRRSPQRVDFRVVSSALPRRPKKRF